MDHLKTDINHQLSKDYAGSHDKRDQDHQAEKNGDETDDH